ncbi:hypothetical protein [Microbulbifer sp. S227A]|uniref:hypothetical protein n=1 Tax=Microbulbifer sp. S227A TaxID=3415131 RepID=UPI003C7C3A8A
MEDDPSAYQGFKLWLAIHVPLERNTLHYLVGAVLVAGAVIWSRRGLRLGPFLIALAVALLMGVAMELADRRDDLASLGHWRWRASIADICRTIALPLAGVLLLWRGRRNRE